MFRHLAILLLSTVLGTLAWRAIDAPRDEGYWPLLKPARWRIEELIRKELGLPSGYGQYGRDDYSRYSAENEYDDEDDEFIENCYESKPIRFGSRKPFEAISPRTVKPDFSYSQSMLRTARNPRRDPRTDPRIDYRSKLPRSVWIPVSMPGSYSRDSKYQWDSQQDYRSNEGYVRPVQDTMIFSEPVNIKDFAKTTELESDMETKFPWSEKPREEQLFEPLDLNGPNPDKSRNENININANSNLGRRYSRPPQPRRRRMPPR